jgi:hypothetical protein
MSTRPSLRGTIKPLRQLKGVYEFSNVMRHDNGWALHVGDFLVERLPPQKLYVTHLSVKHYQADLENTKNIKILSKETVTGVHRIPVTCYVFTL